MKISSRDKNLVLKCFEEKEDKSGTLYDILDLFNEMRGANTQKSSRQMSSILLTLEYKGLLEIVDYVQKGSIFSGRTDTPKYRLTYLY